MSELLLSSTVLVVNLVDPSSLPVGMSFRLTKLPFVSIYNYEYDSVVVVCMDVFMSHRLS